MLELIEEQRTQENSYFSAKERSEDEVEYIGETENKEDHNLHDTI